MQKVHFIGVGGIGVSALAQIYLHQGHQISGSDQKASDLTDNLATQGAKIFIGHKAEHISNQDLLIYSPAIPEENPELLAARAKNIKCLSYPEALGLLSQNYFTIAVSGTHGKSTTTAMIALLLTEAGLDPTVIIGTKVREFQNHNYRLGQSKYLVVEACEYKEAFTNLKPQILIITNIEAEHLDYYKNEENYIAAFTKLANALPKNAHIIIDHTDQNSIKATQNAKANLIPWQNQIDFPLQIPGDHNLKNATFAAETAKLLEIPFTTIKHSLQNFRGTWRRMEYKGQRENTHFYDDYAHHPTEIRATLKALRDKYGSEAKILTIFQPHQYSRTYELLTEFTQSFSDTNEVIIPNIYRVRDSEADVAKVSVQDLVTKIGPKAKDGRGLEETTKWLKENYQNYDLVITMGAGDIGEIQIIE